MPPVSAEARAKPSVAAPRRPAVADETASRGAPTVEPLRSAQPGFAPFTFPRLARLLGADAPAPVVAVGAHIGGRPAGLALGWCSGAAASVLSVAVAAPHRRRGLGRALLAALAEASRDRGAAAMEMRWSGGLPGRAALEALLARAGWGAPWLDSVQLVGFAGAMAEAGGRWPGVRRMLDAPGHCRFEPWASRDGDEAAVVRLLAESSSIQAPDPRRWAATLVPEVSFALRHEGALIGWVIGEPVAGSLGRDTLSAEAPSINYPTAYCALAHRRRGVLIAGYHRAFSAQAALHGPRSRAVYRTHPGAGAMLALTVRRFAPLAIRLDEIFVGRREMPPA